MKDPKIRMKSKDETKVMTDDIRERLDRIDKDLTGLTLEDSMAMLVEGLLRPN
jgi:hypothetical protein